MFVLPIGANHYTDGVKIGRHISISMQLGSFTCSSDVQYFSL